MRFSTIITTAVSAAAVVAVPVEKRALTTDWIVEIVTMTTTVYGASSTSAASVPSPVAALQQGGWGGRHSHSHSRRPQSSTSQAPATTTKTSAVVTQTPSATTTSVEAPAPVIPTTTTAEVSTVEPSVSATESAGPSQSGTPSAGACTTWQAPTDFSVPPESCGVSVLDTINKWRVAYGKTPFVWDEAIAKAAWATLEHNRGGVTMEHPGLINGSGGEVITLGFWEIGDKATQGETPFEVALVAWLCEVGSDKQLQASGFTGIDQCSIAHGVAGISGSANKDEPTGHHDIILGNYVSVGCYYKENEKLSATSDSRWTGQWTCDFGW